MYRDAWLNRNEAGGWCQAVCPPALLFDLISGISLFLPYWTLLSYFERKPISLLLKASTSGFFGFPSHSFLYSFIPSFFFFNLCQDYKLAPDACWTDDLCPASQPPKGIYGKYLLFQVCGKYWLYRNEKPSLHSSHSSIYACSHQQV